MKKITLFVTALLISVMSYSQTFTNYTTADGLSDDSVKAVEVDVSNSLIWFGTDLGASSFDGSTWLTYASDAAGEAPALIIGPRKTLDENLVSSIFVDSNGVTWFGTKAGVWKLVGSTWYIFTDSSNPSDGNTYVVDFLAHHTVYSISEDTAGRMWFATEAGGSMLEDVGGTLTWRNFNINDLNRGANEKTNVVDCASNGDVWFGSEQNGVILLPNGNDPLVANDWIEYTKSSTSDGLAEDRVVSIGIDENNNSWFGSHSGVSQLIQGSPDVWAIYDTGGGNLLNDRVTAIFTDNDNNMWFGTEAGVSRFVMNSTWENFTTATNTNGSIVGNLVHDKVRGIDFDSNTGDFWFATDGGVSRLSNIVLASGGVEAHSDFEMSAYPNPSAGKVEIRLAEMHQNVTIAIVNITGQLVFETSREQTDVITFDMTSFSEGVYLGKITSEKGVSTVKLIKK